MQKLPLKNWIKKKSCIIKPTGAILSWEELSLYDIVPEEGQLFSTSPALSERSFRWCFSSRGVLRRCRHLHRVLQPGPDVRGHPDQGVHQLLKSPAPPGRVDATRRSRTVARRPEDAQWIVRGNLLVNIFVTSVLHRQNLLTVNIEMFGNCLDFWSHQIMRQQF